MDFCSGGELFAFLDQQPMKVLKEEDARYLKQILFIFCIHELAPCGHTGNVIGEKSDLFFPFWCCSSVFHYPTEVLSS